MAVHGRLDSCLETSLLSRNRHPPAPRHMPTHKVPARAAHMPGIAHATRRPRRCSSPPAVRRQRHPHSCRLRPYARRREATSPPPSRPRIAARLTVDHLMGRCTDMGHEPSWGRGTHSCAYGHPARPSAPRARGHLAVSGCMASRPVRRVCSRALQRSGGAAPPFGGGGLRAQGGPAQGEAAQRLSERPALSVMAATRP